MDTETMRVLQLVSRDEPGGVQVLTRMIEAGFSARGIEVDTLALIRQGTTGERLSHLGHVARRIAAGRYDAIFSYHAAAGLVMATVGRAAGVGKRLSHLTAMPDAIHARWRALDKLAGATGGYSEVIANSAATAAAFSDYPAAFTRRIHTIPHGVVPVPAPLRQVDWKERLGIAPASRVLVAAGRLTPQKNYETAIKALALRPDSHLAIAGDGPLRDSLEALAGGLNVRERLHLPGSLQRAELGDFFAIADIYLSPSNWETFGLAAVEAQMAGLPVIATDLPVLREVLGAAADPTTLAFHPVGDAQALATAIDAMLASPPDPNTLQAVADAARRRYGLETMVRSYLDLLE
jgi:glycosyltransferase involved in cell wall biosynthesis